ncbi:MAG: patatin-like phospholipase family protein [Hyphomicrobiaceae bacterium]
MTGQTQEKTVLVLQGGGALGAYQAGAYEGLSEAGITPSWIAGISIGAINAAIIAGNPPDQRVGKLRSFWEQVSSGLRGNPFLPGEFARSFFNEMTAATSALFGVPGFFEPRLPSPLFAPPGSPGALSLYQTAPLRESLMSLVDFALIKTGSVRLSVGAVNIRTGNFVYFDSAERDLAPEHVMASGALPPGFPPVVIEGEAYWDGGLVSNTPLQFVLDTGEPREDMVVFQVDVFSARGRMPRTLADVAQREKEIRYSSRTRLNTDVFSEIQTLRRAATRLTAKLPKELRDDADAKLLRGNACDAAITIVHLINRQPPYETETRDYEFSRLSVEEHWEAGRNDVRRTLRHKAWKRRTRPSHGVAVLDLTEDGSE